MVEVYYYLPTRHVDNAVACGLKLSDWYNKEVVLEGDRKKCISALLNPGDDKAKYVSADYKCLKLEILPKYCYVADSLLYRIGLTNPEAMDMYERSLIPVERYNFGHFRLPECLLTCTVIGEYVKVLDKRLDSPIFFNNSEELYMGNIIEGFKEMYSDFNDALLYSFFCRLVENGNMKKIENAEGNLAIFADSRHGKVYTIKVPDLGKF